MAEGLAGTSSNNLSISSNLIWTGYAEVSVMADRPKTISIPVNSKYIIVQDFSKNKSCVILKGCSNIIRCNITENGGIAICSLNSTGT